MPGRGTTGRRPSLPATVLTLPTPWPAASTDTSSDVCLEKAVLRPPGLLGAPLRAESWVAVALQRTLVRFANPGATLLIRPASRKKCVVKTTSVVNRAKPRAALFSLREALALTYLPPHNNIPALLDFVAGPKETHLILDLAPGEELFNYVNSTALGRLGEAETRAIVVGILEALRHAHENGVVHRDVKLDNVFWDPVSQKVSERCRPQRCQALTTFFGTPLSEKVSLLDFGLATFFEDGTTCTEPLGCINYASPQLLRLTNTGVPYGAARGWSDLWALGILTHGLLTGYFPFRAEEPIELEREIRETWMNASELEGVPAREVSRECRHFLHTILNPANEGLLTAADLLAHPWLASLASTAPVVHTSSPFPRLPSSTNDLRRQARLVADELQARLPAFRMKMARLLVPGWQPTPFFLSPDHAASLPSRTPSPASSIETAIMDIDRNAEFDSTKSRGPLFSGLSFKSSAPSSSFSSITSVSSTASKTSAVRKWFSRLAGKQ